MIEPVVKVKHSRRSKNKDPQPTRTVKYKRVKPGSMRIMKVKTKPVKSAKAKKLENPDIIKEELNLSEPLKEAITIVLKSVLSP